MMTVAVVASHPDEIPRAKELAKTLQFPFFPDIISAQAAKIEFLLIQSASHLALQQVNETKLLPLWFDFTSKKSLYRLKHASKKTELIIRAMGQTSRDNTKIIDVTAGTGQDSLLLASLGYDVTLVERSPIVYALLADAYQRAHASTELRPILARMHLIFADSLTYLSQHQQNADIIYLDPMFPTRHKSAQVKKEMQWLQNLLTTSEDNSDTLFEMALTCAVNRVVVKRPRLGKILTPLTPSFSIIGKSSRFDVYMILNNG